MPETAAIYIADPSLLMGPRFLDSLEGVQSYEGINVGDAAVGLRFTFEAGQVEMNFLAKDQMPQHLRNIDGYARTVVKDSNQLAYVQARLHYVRLVCGCVITPDYDDTGTIEDFLFRFNRAVNGLLVASDQIFDYDGEVLGGVGPEATPEA